MAFCRRCGDIVVGVKCAKCGGMAVAPVVPWHQPDEDGKNQDRWSRTYVQRPKSAAPTREPNLSIPNTPVSPTKRFPRPTSSGAISSPLSNSSSCLSLSPPKTDLQSSPKPSAVTAPTVFDILPSIDPNDPTLSKVYGSVLQRPETLETHSCVICSSTFPPDATIYPHPSDPTSSNYLCRPCFEANGGSKGICPTCSRPVLILRSEGGFIHASGSFWHKRCFNCSGCHKNIGDAPMVDLYGKPSCPQCFDTCAGRQPTIPPKRLVLSARSGSPVDKSNRTSRVGPSSERQKDRVGNPVVLKELEQRLGIVTDREGSPSVDDLTERLSTTGLDAGMQRTYRQSQSSPVGLTSRRSNLSSAPTPEAIEEMKQRFMKATPSNETPSVRPLRLSRSFTTLRSSQKIFQPQASDEPISPNSPPNPLTPDLMSDLSDSVTQYSDSPPANDAEIHDVFTVTNGDTKQIHFEDDARSQDDFQEGTGITNSIESPSHVLDAAGTQIRKPAPADLRHSGVNSTDSLAASSCAHCCKSLFSINEGGRLIIVPPTASDASPMTYHIRCFKCVICNGVFTESASGQAVFVRVKGGACHPECAPVGKINLKTTPKVHIVQTGRQTTPTPSTSSTPAVLRSSPRSTPKSSRLDRPSDASQVIPSRRFGSSTTCPGCKKAVSPMEYGVVPGPQGSRWHASCLICGGKKGSLGPLRTQKGREEKAKCGPGCGKKLDSAAKTAADGSVWCRECLLLLGVGGLPNGIAPSHTSTAGPMVSQSTGTTTLARQFTGLCGAGEPTLLRQLTGGGLSPTRSISPTKQSGGIRPRPRPKSVIGMRTTKSADVGRAVYLVRQMSGAGAAD